MTKYITDDNGNIIFSKLIILLICMTLISYITSFSWYKPNYKKQAFEIVEEYQGKCPIKYSSDLYLDSIKYDGNKIITQYISGYFVLFSEEELFNMKLLYKERFRDEINRNSNLKNFLMNSDMSIRQKIINKNNLNQAFEFVIDKEVLKERYHE